VSTSNGLEGYYEAKNYSGKGTALKQAAHASMTKKNPAAYATRVANSLTPAGPVKAIYGSVKFVQELVKEQIKTRNNVRRQNGIYVTFTRRIRTQC
jgi:hypothetical protein